MFTKNSQRNINLKWQSFILRGQIRDRQYCLTLISNRFFFFNYFIFNPYIGLVTRHWQYQNLSKIILVERTTLKFVYLLNLFCNLLMKLLAIIMIWKFDQPFHEVQDIWVLNKPKVFLNGQCLFKDICISGSINSPFALAKCGCIIEGRMAQDRCQSFITLSLSLSLCFLL